MKKTLKLFIALLCCLALTVPVVSMAGAEDYSQGLAEDFYTDVDYYVTVTAYDGVNLREGDALGASLITNIPAGETLHITCESLYDDSIGASWGRTEYNGMTGFISLCEVTKIDSAAPAEPAAQPAPASSESAPATLQSTTDYKYTDCLEEAKANTSLINYLKSFNANFINYDGRAYNEYDFTETYEDEDITARLNILANILTMPDAFAGPFFFGITSSEDGTQNIISDKEELARIARLCFNADEEAVDALMENSISSGGAMVCYYEDGSFYGMAETISDGAESTVTINEAHKIGDIYYIAYTYDNTAAAADYYAVLQKKTFNDTPYWSMYSNSAEENKNFMWVPVSYFMD